MEIKLIPLKELYDVDENMWLFENARLIQAGKLDLVDWEHIAEELELMGKSQLREVFSRMTELILYLLKWMFQKDHRSVRWEVSIKEQRDELNEIFKDSKNLKSYGQNNFDRAYETAKDLVISETRLPLNQFPEKSPFTFEQVLDKKYWLEDMDKHEH